MERGITLRELWAVFARRWGVLLLAAVLGFLAAFLYGNTLRTPQYRSTATLYVLRQGEGTDTDFAQALRAAEDCAYMLQSHAVLEQVMEELNLEMELRELTRKVSVNRPADTRFLELSVETGSPKLSQKLADALCRAGTEKINATLGFEQIRLYEGGTLPDGPCNELSPGRYVLASVIVAALGYFVCVLLYLRKKNRIENAPTAG